METMALTLGLDDTELTYLNEKEFLNAIKERQAKTVYMVVPARELSFEPLGSYCARYGLTRSEAASALGVDAVLVDDTARHTDLIVHTPDGSFLLGIGARISISNRISIEGAGLYQLASETLARVYNERMHSLKQEVKLVYCFGKIRAIMSNLYREVEAGDVFAETLRIAHERFGDADFVGGHITHNRYEARVVFPEAAAELKRLYGLDGDIVPGLRILTSDTGFAANQVAPFWAGRRTSWVNDSERIYVIHKGRKNGLERVVQQLPNLFLRYQNTAEKFVELMKIPVLANPERVIRRACRDLKLGKRLKRALVEEWRFTSVLQPTAYDLCRHLLTAASLVDSPTVKEIVEAKVGRAINLPWRSLVTLTSADDKDEEDEE